MTTDKQFISAQMDSRLVDALAEFAREHGITRSAALRLAIANLVGKPVA
ncbi:MAG: ribbon-helix-helix protein, CopG family [Acidimicrobiales bacterium]